MTRGKFSDMRLVLVFLVVAACAKPAPRVTQVVAPVDPVAQIRAQLEATYTAISQGEAERIAPLLADDVLVYGLGPQDTFNTKEPFITRLGQLLLPLGLGADSLTISDSAPVIGLSAGEESAWLFDFPKAKIVHKSTTSTYLPRVTAHLLRTNQRWQIDALHVSLGVADAVVYSPDAPKRLLPPADVINERGPKSEELVGLTKRLLEDFEVKLERASDRREFVEIGSSPAEVFEVGKKFKELSRPALPAIRKEGYSWKLDGNLRTRLAPDGKSGWAAGNVVLRIGSGKKQKVLPAFRTLWVFVEERGVWNLASEHQSLGVKEDLREPATPEDLTLWADTRAISKKNAEAAAAAKPSKSSSPDAGTSDPSIGVW